MVALKRSWNAMADETVEEMVMANCVTIVSRRRDGQQGYFGGRVYECKTCKKQFDSFQALGGHRASHRKPRILNRDGEDVFAKKHVCGVCGMEFDRGQALGGHMSKHRTHKPPVPAKGNSEDGESNSNNRSSVTNKEPVEAEVAVAVTWDLNLTPFQNLLKIVR